MPVSVPRRPRTARRRRRRQLREPRGLRQGRLAPRDVVDLVAVVVVHDGLRLDRDGERGVVRAVDRRQAVREGDGRARAPARGHHGRGEVVARVEVVLLVCGAPEVEGDPGHHRNCQATVNAMSLTSGSAEVERDSQVFHPESERERITRH